MEQEKIWDYFQSDEANHRFPEARQRYMLRYLKKGSIVLNIGVGNGSLERFGIGKGIEMHTLDPSEKAIARIRTELNMNNRAQVGYAQSMPFMDGIFDTVVMSEVLEHLGDAILGEALQEVRRVLKPGGFLLASTPYRENLAANRVVCPRCAEVFHKVGHVQSFNKESMRSLLEGHGLKVDKLWISTFVNWQRGGVRNLIKSIVRLGLGRLGEGIADPHVIVIATKRC